MKEHTTKEGKIMGITCESGFSNYLPPFLGNVRIKNFRLSKYNVRAGEEVHALGKAEKKLWTPYNSWGPLNNKVVQIKWAWAGTPKEITATGKTDGHGYFDIEFEGPYVTEQRSVLLWASLPEPHGGFPDDHLECGPLELRSLPREEEKGKGIPKYVYAAPIIGVGLGWLASR